MMCYKMKIKLGNGRQSLGKASTWAPLLAMQAMSQFHVMWDKHFHTTNPIKTFCNKRYTFDSFCHGETMSSPSNLTELTRNLNTVDTHPPLTHAMTLSLNTHLNLQSRSAISSLHSKTYHPPTHLFRVKCYDYLTKTMLLLLSFQKWIKMEISDVLPISQKPPTANTSSSIWSYKKIIQLLVY
jgi:hypothetical protein